MSDELDKILDKSFEDLRRRLKSYILRYEKRLLRDMKNGAPKAPKEKEKERKKKAPSTSGSSGSSSDE